MLSNIRVLAPSSLALLTTLAVLNGGCGVPGEPQDLTLEEVEGTYSPIRLDSQIKLSATVGSYEGRAYSKSINANLLSDLDPLVDQIWDTATIHVEGSSVVLIRNPGQADEAAYGLATSNLAFFTDSISANTQLGQTLSTLVSTGCEAVTGQYLDLSMGRDSFSAQVTVSSYFNDISPSGGAPVVTCDDLRAQIQAELRSADVTPENRLFGVFVTNQVITDTQVADVFVLDVASGFSARKSSSEIAPRNVTDAAPAADDTGSNSQAFKAAASNSATPALKQFHDRLVKFASAAAAR